MTSKLETEILHWRTKTAAYMVFAKARLTEVIEQLCYYQLLCIYSADGFQSRAFANTRTDVAPFGATSDRRIACADVALNGSHLRICEISRGP